MTPQGTVITALRRERAIIALALLALGIHVIESGIPSPIPGVKPGIANAIALYASYHFGWRAAVAITLVRVVAGGLLLGTLFSPTFWISLSGAMAALAVLIWTQTPGSDAPKSGATGFDAAGRLAAGRFGIGPIGRSVLMAQAHVLAQFALVWTVLLPVPELLLMLPVLLAAAILGGIVTGWLAARLLVAQRSSPV